MPEPLSWNEWVDRPRPSLPRPIARALALVMLAVAGVSTGLWLNHSEPSSQLVVGMPAAATLNDGRTTHAFTFIERLVDDLNNNVPCPTYGCVGSCLGQGVFQQDRIRFDYGNGDRLTVDVNSGCNGRVYVGVSSSTGYAVANADVLTDLDNWPAG